MHSRSGKPYYIYQGSAILCFSRYAKPIVLSFVKSNCKVYCHNIQYQVNIAILLCSY